MSHISKHLPFPEKMPQCRLRPPLLIGIILMQKNQLSAVNAAARIHHVKICPDACVQRIPRGRKNTGSCRTVGDDDFILKNTLCLFHLFPFYDSGAKFYG